MAFNQETGTADLRKEVIDKVIRDIAKPKYKFMQAVQVTKTNAWKNTFFRGSTEILAGGTGNETRGIPRGANFPQAVTTLEEVNAWVEKYGLEDFIHWEDILTNDVDIQKRTLFKLTQGVVKAVDDQIWDVLTESQTPVNIQSVSLTHNEAWDGSSAAIIDNLMQTKQLIGEQNYETGNLMAFISEKDHRSIVNYLAEKGAQFPSVGEAMAMNGRSGKLAGIQLVISNSVTASYSLVVVPKTVGTWRDSVSLRSDIEKEAFKGTRIRIVQMGVAQLTDPLAAVLIDGTQL